MYRCWNCGWRFEEPVHEEICAEDYYGVGSQFPRADRHYFTLHTCPSCCSEQIEEFDEEDEYDEFEE